MQGWSSQKYLSLSFDLSRRLLSKLIAQISDFSEKN